MRWTIDIVKRFGWSTKKVTDPLYVRSVRHLGPFLLIEWVA